MERYRGTHPIAGRGDKGSGIFKRNGLRIIASSGMGWDHVSVSRAERCPTWEEMHAVRQWFFAPEEACMQIHPPMAAHINCHPFCLHLWRPHDQEIPLPPTIMIA